MVDAGKGKPQLPPFSWFVVYGVALGTLMFLLENIFDVALPSWCKATIGGVGFFVFVVVYSRFHNVAGREPVASGRKESQR